MSSRLSAVILTTSDINEQTSSVTSRLHRTHGPRFRSFLKGPIPFEWLQDVARLGGSSLPVGLSIWLYHSRSRGTFRASMRELGKPFGVSAQSVRKAVHGLMRAGLVVVHHAPGCKGEFTIQIDRYTILSATDSQ